MVLGRHVVTFCVSFLVRSLHCIEFFINYIFFLKPCVKVFVLCAAGVPAVHAGAAHPYGDRKGEEPLAKRGRTLGCTPAGTTWKISVSVVDPDPH